MPSVIPPKNQTSGSRFKDSVGHLRFWWTPLGAISALLCFSAIWVGALNGESWPASGWTIALGPWGYDTINFPGSQPELFLTLWLVPLTALLLLVIGIARMVIRPLHWTRIWAWIFTCVSLAILVMVAAQGYFLKFPFWGTGVSLIISGLGLFAMLGWSDPADRDLTDQQRLSRRHAFLSLAGMAGLAVAGAGVVSWLVAQSLRAHAKRTSYTLPNNSDPLLSKSYTFFWTPQNTFVMAQYQKLGNSNNTLGIWELAPATRQIALLGPEFAYDDVVFSPDGHTLAVCCFNSSYNSTSFLYNLQTGTSVPLAFVSPIVSWSHDSTRLAGGDNLDSDGLRIWDVARNRQIVRHPTPGDSDLLRQVAWSPNDQWLATRETPEQLSTLRLYEAQTGKNVFTQNFGQLQPQLYIYLSHIAWSPNSRYLALSFTNFELIRDPITPYPILVWDIAAWKLLLSYTGHVGGAGYVAWSPDGTYVASGGRHDATVQIWHATTGEQVFSFYGHKKSIIYVKWSPDGKLIASADEDQVLTWDAPPL